MRDPHLKAIEYKIARIRTMRRIGKMLLVTAVIVAGIITFSHLDTTMAEQQKAMPIISDLSEESISVDKLVDEQDKVAVIEDLIPNNTSCGVLTTQELDIVCRVVAAEARGEDLQGMMGVAQVIRDRANAWDMTVTEVCTAPSQFAKPYQGEISDEVKLAVANVFDGNMSVLEVPTTHFYADYIDKPYWASSKINRGKIGNHRFYY